jgi:protein-ribulosamine 3-kinase
MQIASFDRGLSMFRGEYESMSIIHSLVPTLAVKPLAYGACSSAEDIYFFLSEFSHFGQNADAKTLGCAVAELHLKSRLLHESLLASKRIPARFGFDVSTHLGMLPLKTTWSNSWSDFFTAALESVLSFLYESQDPPEEFRRLSKVLLETIIPRLLDPLDTWPNQIQPVFLHGDLMLGNARIDESTGQPKFYDAGSFWGHNECKSSSYSERRAYLIRSR